jgi:Ca-activated chloride channel family protein
VSFASPLALWSLILVPLAIAGYVWAQRRRSAEAARFVSPALLPNLVERVPGWRRHLPAALLLLAVTSFLFGFARPHAKLSVRSQQATVVLAIDSSRSMGASDVHPTRLAVAQAAARRFVAGLPIKYRVAVVAFSSRAQVVSAPTTDRQFVDAAIAELRPGDGTAIGDGVANAIQVVSGRAAGSKPPAKPSAVPAAILIISDGAADGGKITLGQAITRARTAKIPVFSALVGTTNGLIKVKLVGGYTEQIKVPPDASLLRRVATQTGGRYFDTTNQSDLKAVYGNLGSRLGHTRKDEEITVAFAAVGAVLLTCGCALSALWFRRIP